MPSRKDVLIIAEQCGAQNSGMGVYAFEVAPRLAARLAGGGFRIGVAVRADAEELADRSRASGAEIVQLGRRDAGIAKRLFESFISLPAQASGYACYLSLDHKLPPRALSAGAARVVTVHDTCAQEWPAEFDLVRRFYFGQVIPRMACSADRVVTVSNFAARRIEALLGVSRSRIVVAPNGFDSGRCSALPEVRDDEVLRHYGLERGYFLFLGRVSPRKNLQLVVEAVKRLSQAGLAPKVAMAGPPGWRDGADWHRIRKAGLADRFPTLGYVTPEALAPLYRGSAGLLYPSRCEGFGIPVLEALACGVPVVVAEGTSAAEVGGQFALRVDPDDADALAGFMRDMMREAHRPVADSGVAGWLAKFSWDRTAELVADGVHPLLLSQSKAAATGRSRAA